LVLAIRMAKRVNYKEREWKNLAYISVPFDAEFMDPLSFKLRKNTKMTLRHTQNEYSHDGSQYANLTISY
jgi:hypothetical protein